ncbi:MAG: helicase-related protein [Phycisphaerales bacterium]
MGKLSGGAKLRLVAGVILLASGVAEPSWLMILAGLGLLASFAWTFSKLHQLHRDLEPFPMPPEMRAVAEAMARPIDPTPLRTLPPDEKSLAIAQVATTPEALDRLMADKPPAWPWAVFASVMVQRRNAVGDRLRMAAAGYQPRPGRERLSGRSYAAVAYLTMTTILDLIHQLEQFIPSPAFKGAFGDGQGDETADAEAIADIADRQKDYHESFLDQAEALRGQHDSKFASLVAELKKLLKDGFSPIVFCRFIDTAEYVAEELRDAFKKVEVAAVTGHLAAADREARIAELAKAEKRILVCTDCLSEGVNLQEHFDAVVHYDLSWNPTRHEQREGRVDRFGQKRDEVRLLTMHGENNFIDVLVLNVLLRKHKEIRRRLDVSVAVPRSASDVVARLYDEVRSKIDAITERQLLLDFGDYSGKEELHAEWEARAERVSRSVFAQATISPQEVQAELELVRQSIGDAPTVERFLRDVFSQLKVPVFSNGPRLEVAISSEAPRSLRNAIDRDAPFAGRVELPVKRGELHLARTHPIVEGLASWVLDTALDPRGLRDRDPLAARCGVSRIAGLEARVVVLLLRLRHHLLAGGRRARTPLLAEEILPVGFTGPANAPQWLDTAAVESALAQPPAANVLRSVALDAVKDALAALPSMQPALEAIAADRAESLRASHLRVRQSSKAAGTVTVEPVLPVDVLGVFVLLPHRTT